MFTQYLKNVGVNKSFNYPILFCNLKHELPIGGLPSFSITCVRNSFSDSLWAQSKPPLFLYCKNPSQGITFAELNKTVEHSEHFMTPLSLLLTNPEIYTIMFSVSVGSIFR